MEEHSRKNLFFSLSVEIGAHVAGQPCHKLEVVTILQSLDIGNGTFFCNKGLTVIIYHLKKYAGFKSVTQ